MTVHLLGGASTPRSGQSDSGTWVTFDVLRGIGVDVKDLGSGQIGLCPDPEQCVVVPDDARHGEEVRLDRVAESLDLVVADDGHHAVVRRGHASATSHLALGDTLDLTLPDLDGDVRPVVAQHGRMAVFLWASW